MNALLLSAKALISPAHRQFPAPTPDAPSRTHIELTVRTVCFRCLTFG